MSLGCGRRFILQDQPRQRIAGFIRLHRNLDAQPFIGRTHAGESQASARVLREGALEVGALCVIEFVVDVGAQ